MPVARWKAGVLKAIPRAPCTALGSKRKTGRSAKTLPSTSRQRCDRGGQLRPVLPSPRHPLPLDVQDGLRRGALYLRVAIRCRRPLQLPPHSLGDVQSRRSETSFPCKLLPDRGCEPACRPATPLVVFAFYLLFPFWVLESALKINPPFFTPTEEMQRGR